MEKKESRESEGGNQGIQHLSHDHGLTLDEDNKAEGVLCYGCFQPISLGGPVYTCTPCQFFLHKFCAELPEKMVHPFHIEHQLSLLPRAGPSNDYICDICGQERPTGFSYNCDPCHFFVDVKCASIKIKTQQPMEMMEHESHKHKLIPLGKSSNFLCDVCATKHDGSSSYVCVDCGFLVYQECAFLPLTIRHPHHHDHDLTLIHSIPYEYYKPSSRCQICSERVFRNQWVYFCSQCRYFLHIKCSPASSAFKIATMGKKESREIQHLSHRHKLTLHEDNKAGGVRCDGCLEPISSGSPVYTCTRCHFFLHKFCAELPKEIRHPSHVDHQLSLLPRAGLSNHYKCEICRQVRPTEFSYHCEPCGFFVDIKCASIMIKIQQTMEMEHGSHTHKLIPIEKSVNPSCDICATKHEGSSYLCTECGFWINQKCAFLPPTIRLSDDSYHHDHDLTLIHSIPYEYFKSSTCCQICSERVFRNQWVYFCSQCRYFVHIKCSPASSAFKKENREIPHLSHYHPLTLDEDNEAGGVRCDGCLQPISSGPVYTCTRCQFFLHKFCAKLPEKITHPSHIQHQLSLLPRHGRYRNDYRCDICRQQRPTEFSYQCDDCNFCVDIKCASMMIKIQQPMEMEHGSHKHKLTPLEKSSNFLCDVCATKHEGSSYVCTECGFWINQKCAFLPPTVKLSDDDHHHDHDLTLIHSPPYTSFCEICSESIYKNQWAYFCSKCRYFFVHIKCSPPLKTQHSRDDKEEIKAKRIHSKLASFPWANEYPEEFGNLVARLIKNVVGPQEKKTTDDDKLGDTSHIHDHEPLIFSADNLQSEIIVRCNVCKQIISTSFYKCAKSDCKFHVHQWCAKLPKELDHSCHPQHLLRLLTQESLDDLPRCECCGFFNTTFYYGCRECGFYLDVKCAGVPSGIYHESHDHPLTLRLFWSCSICGSLSGYYAFVCEACSHTVCIPCAFLPGKVNHRYDKHPFTLTYSSPYVKDEKEVKDEFEKEEYYYCEICEKDINPKCWFYHCYECDQSLHIKCICPDIDLMYSKITL